MTIRYIVTMIKISACDCISVSVRMQRSLSMVRQVRRAGALFLPSMLTTVPHFFSFQLIFIPPRREGYSFGIFCASVCPFHPHLLSVWNHISVSARPEFLGVIDDSLFENLGVIDKFREPELF